MIQAVVRFLEQQSIRFGFSELQQIDQSMPTQNNQRLEARVRTKLPVTLGAASGLTRDISASGICFEVDTSYVLGGDISFVITLNKGTETLLLKCKGSIVRTEEHGLKKSVAVKLIESELSATDRLAAAA